MGGYHIGSLSPTADCRYRPGMRRLLLLSCLSLACATNSAPEPSQVPAQSSDTASTVADPHAARMELLSARIEAKRKELEIPGLALVVVKDGKVVLSRGFGVRDLQTNEPVDEDTLFAIGSTTKAFTAMLVMMAVDEGKISLDDHPRKCVPYFKLSDKEDDAKITVRDLLTHSSGLMRTDLGWYTGKLSTEEIIRVAGLAEPTADLRERFQYQNVMYAAAGECVANLYKKSYVELMQERFFTPLGMTHGTNISVAENLKHPKRAIGYTKAGPEEVLMPVPMRPIDNVAAAGAINTSIRDIAPWLQLMLASGTYGGNKFVSDTSFRQITKTQQKIAGPLTYTLGWMRDLYKTHRRLHHGGGIDGFVTLISLLPKDKVGFALFTNIQNGDIHGYVTEEVFGALLDDNWGAESGDPSATPALPVSAKNEVGRYGVVGGATMEVIFADNKLTLKVPRQPNYELLVQNAAARKYRLGPPAPSGFYATFRPRQDDPNRQELLLEQPQGPMVMPRLIEADFEAVKKAGIPDNLSELLGVYAIKDRDIEIEVGLSEGRVALMPPGQDPAPLVANDDGTLGLAGMPETFKVEPVREGKKLIGLKVTQPSTTLDLELRARKPFPKIKPEQLFARMRKAAKSDKLNKLGTIVARGNVEFVNQGLQGIHEVHRAYPNKLREHVIYKGLGREIGNMLITVDGNGTAARTSDFTETLPLSNEESNAFELEAMFDTIDPNNAAFETPEILRAGTLDKEPTIVVRRKVKTGGSVIMHVSSKSFHLLKVESYLPAGPDGQEIGTTYRFEDYRTVKGVPIAHKITAQGPQGKIVETVESVTLGEVVDDKVFTQ